MICGCHRHTFNVFGVVCTLKWTFVVHIGNIDEIGVLHMVFVRQGDELYVYFAHKNSPSHI
jgi:hypothetical protein